MSIVSHIVNFLYHAQYAEGKAVLAWSVGVIFLIFSIRNIVVLENIIGNYFISLAIILAIFGFIAKQAITYARGPTYVPSVDLTDKVVIVTGAATGIGFENCVDFLKLNATVILAARGAERCKLVMQEMKKAAGVPLTSNKIYHIELDLSSFASIRNFAKIFMEKEKKLDILINNAGIITDSYQLTAEGFEMQTGTNHIGHFLLTSLLEPYIRQSKGRVVQISSSAHHFAVEGIDYRDRNSTKDNYSIGSTYSQTKLKNLLYAYELNKRLSSSGAHAYSVHPGCIATKLQQHVLDKKPFASYATAVVNALILKPVAEGSKTTLYCAMSREARPGYYHADCSVAKHSSHAISDDEALKLWTTTEELIKQADQTASR